MDISIVFKFRITVNHAKMNSLDIHICAFVSLGSFSRREITCHELLVSADWFQVPRDTKV